MARYLTFHRSKSYAYTGTWPDENYAREFMQLFTIGIWKLEDDGTESRDESGNLIPTYDNDDIMTFASAWTGFDDQHQRGNQDWPRYDRAENMFDPMQVKGSWRDMFPKMDLGDGFIGDRLPLCVDLPSKAFLRTGAKYVYLGSSPLPTMQDESGHIVLDASSQLYEQLCAQDGGSCQFPSSITLAENFACQGVECLVDTATVVAVVDSDKTIYYEYVQVACTRLAFYADAGQIKGKGWNGQVMCADKNIHAAGTACCAAPDTDTKFGFVVFDDAPTCEYHEERVAYRTAEARCAEAGQFLCHRHTRVKDDDDLCGYVAPYTWLSRACALQVQVASSGKVAIVHGGEREHAHATQANPDPAVPLFDVDSGNYFRIVWKDGIFPTVTAGCPAPACTVQGETCLCDTVVSTTAVFDRLPTKQEIIASLHIGSASPEVFDAGQYTHFGTFSTPTSGPSDDVEVYMLAGHDQFDSDTVFKVTVHGAPIYYSNTRSVVQIQDFEFRNPPQFMALEQPETRDAMHESEYLIDYMFKHKNTAPFISTRLIQRFTSSNPSPRYVRTVAAAFRSGEYGGRVYGGVYGDLAATLAAILMDRESVSASVEADPAHGKLREPVLKILHFMRALEYQSKDGQEVILYQLVDAIGMQAYNSPSVFSFYQPDYQPSGRISNAKLFAPEAQLATAPFMIGYLNGMVGLSKYGLSGCNNGFGQWRAGIACAEQSDGALTVAPSSFAELDLLLTGGRLSPSALAVVEGAYDSIAHGARHWVTPGNPLTLKWGTETLLLEEALPALDTAKYGMRCCADADPSTEGITGWSKKWCFGEEIWAASAYTVDGVASECQMAVTYAEAEAQCAAGGGRVCTRAEVEEGCVKSTGCSLDAAFVWTSDVTPEYPDAESDGMKLAEQLIVASAEFNTAGSGATKTSGRPERQVSPSLGRPYKAVVVVYLNGGVDSYNILVPHSECSEKDMYQVGTLPEFASASMKCHACRRSIATSGRTSL
jgi:cullin-associated NEDD8-dissociated protein 1